MEIMIPYMEIMIPYMEIMIPYMEIMIPSMRIYQRISNISKEFIIERVDDLFKNGKLVNKVTAKGLNFFFRDEIRTNVSDQEDSSESSETEKCIEPKAIIVETPNGELGTTLYNKDNENKLNAQFMTLKSFVFD